MNRTLDDEVLRAVGHVKALVAAGDAVETIVHTLAHRNLGALSTRLKRILRAVEDGDGFEDSLKDEFAESRQKEKERGYSMLIGVLMMDSDEVEDRLDTITAELMEAGQAAASKHANKCKALSSLALTVMALGMLVPMPMYLWMRFAEQGWFEPPPFTDAACYLGLGVPLAMFLLLMVRRR